MANEEHLARLKQGVWAWNEWRDQYPNMRPDLTGADLIMMDLALMDLTQAHLSRADLSHGVFSGADLSLADLRRANLTGADLSMANLIRADLSGASLREADLSGANLRKANLTMVNLTEADLSETNFSGAHIQSAVFGNVDLNTVRGLESVLHLGPSTIGIDTVYRSHGNLPEVFLRGAGVPDEMITYMKSLVGRPFEFYSCFISYSSQDQEFAKRLHADLQSEGVRCWFALEDIRSGRKIHQQIDEAIRLHERLLLILSAYSMLSEWVKTEIAKARQREAREKWQVLFPMRLVSFEAVRDWECFDADTGKDSAREIREYFIPDFSNWKNHDAYQVAFQRLLRDLKAGT
jgi:uncharacterized protein YjbI with pentapeptide repeats